MKSIAEIAKIVKEKYNERFAGRVGICMALHYCRSIGLVKQCERVRFDEELSWYAKKRPDRTFFRTSSNQEVSIKLGSAPLGYYWPIKDSKSRNDWLDNLINDA